MLRSLRSMPRMLRSTMLRSVSVQTLQDHLRRNGSIELPWPNAADRGVFGSFLVYLLLEYGDSVISSVKSHFEFLKVDIPTCGERAVLTGFDPFKNP